MKAPIPAVWRIDVEPDDHTGVDRQPWQGFVDVATLVNDLRRPLQDRSGHVVHPTWLLRLDPDIESRFGQADFVVRRHGDLVDALIGHGDTLGIHVHPHRHDEERSVTYSDHADTAWTTNCLTVAAQVFSHCFGEPVRRSSQGGYFLTESVLDAAIALGIEVDVTPEPGLAPQASDDSFGAYATAPSSDFRNCPRRPYYPSRESLSVAAASRGTRRPILLVPLTAYDYGTALSSWPRRVAKALLRRPRRHFPLNPWKIWPSPKVYWDLVEQAANEQASPYCAFAIRTDARGTLLHQRVRALLEHLPSHPIAERLRFVDPLGPEIGALAIPAAD